MCRYPHSILATCCVPWTVDGELDEPIFRDAIRVLLEADISNIYLFGTAGEGYAVSDRQFHQVVDVFIQEMAQPDTAPMVGVISLSLTNVIERIERCLEQGVTAFQVSLPSWGELHADEVQRFFAETCGRFTQATFLHYNLPRSRRLVTAAEYATLSNRYPNLVATKNAGADLGASLDLLKLAPQLRHFFTEPGFAWASLFGRVGLLLSVASLNPPLAHRYFAAGSKRDVETLTSMAGELSDITGYLVDELGPARIDGAYDKCFSKVLDERFPLRLLPPYTSATDEQFGRFVAATRARHPHWLDRVAT